MEGETKVKLHVMWVSPYAKMVEMTFRMKGMPYEPIEEDLNKKSELLLQNNPVHKKIPILVHNGNPIAESYVILEYIEEAWKKTPKLLPEDPYERAQIRFWVSIVQQAFEGMCRMLLTNGEAMEKAKEEVFEKVNHLEKGMKTLFPGICDGIEGRELGVLDVMVSAKFSNYKAFEEFFGVKILDPEKTPLLLSWVHELKKLPLVQELMPPHDKFLTYIKYARETYDAQANSSSN